MTMVIFKNFGWFEHDYMEIVWVYSMGDVLVKALNNVSFDIKRGEFAAIMDKSGSDKSTLLHQLGLLDTHGVKLLL
jgi:ABC-type lipoprotein export system ATPase subunit